MRCPDFSAIEREIEIASTSPSTLTATAMREAGEAAADLVEALSDGLTAAEAAKALTDIDNAVRAWSQLRSRVADEARDLARQTTS